MPRILIPAQIQLAYDIEAVQEALAAGFVLPPQYSGAEPDRLPDETDDAYRARVAQWRAENVRRVQSGDDGSEPYRARVDRWRGEENAKIKADQAKVDAERAEAERRLAAKDAGGDILDPPTSANAVVAQQAKAQASQQDRDARDAKMKAAAAAAAADKAKANSDADAASNKTQAESEAKHASPSFYDPYGMNTA